LIDKTRHIVLHEGTRWEIDEFHRANAGLIIAEIELPSEDTVFVRPEWLGDEVSCDFRYANASLSEKAFSTWE
jgi:CYTH domain-containing protein